jgi:hypothetical protein
LAHFIKFVGDLDAICNDGTNENFFDGEDYLQISDRMAEPARIWCQKNLATVKLKSEGATDDEPLEPYVIRLGKKEGTKELKSLVKELGVAFVTIMSGAANAIDAKNVMTSKANEAFDAVEEGARLRTLLLKVAGKRSPSSASALLLNV